jgi:predicted AAA+ superfamily ATPase
MDITPQLVSALTRIADALERHAPPAPAPALLNTADAFVWHADGSLNAVEHVNRIDLSLLRGIDYQKKILMDNTSRFAKGLSANNALIWGARGTGKSSIVKAIHAEVNKTAASPIALVEIHREDIQSLPNLLAILRESGRPCLLFCDDLSFDGQDESYKSLKAVLEGGLEGRPKNVLFYATSNRRHLLARDMIENERSTAIHAGEAVEEKVSLSDRFGLWIGFHNLDQATFLEIIQGYATAFNIPIDSETLRKRAIEWSVTRGGRSGRIAWQFIQDIAGELEIPLPV